MKTFVSDHENHLCAAEVAIKNGLGPGDVFHNGENDRVQMIVDEPGKHLTRGEFGDIYFSITACVWDWENNDYLPMTLDDYEKCTEDNLDWCMWDSHWGWL